MPGRLSFFFFFAQVSVRLPLDGFSWKFILGSFTLICCAIFKICLKSDKNAGHFTWRPKCTVDSRTKWFVARQQWQGNRLLHSLDNTKRFCIADSYIPVNISKMGNIVAFQRQQRLNERALCYVIRTLPILFSSPTIAYWAEIWNLKCLYVSCFVVRAIYFKVRKVLCFI
jgi:hypothetical protein